jgi:OFA family oxalate/formate antiporter-like MFS transporter
VAAATALNAPLGSIYAFSVFLKPLESLLGLSRADLAFVFALAAAGFAAGMNLVPLAFGRVSAPVLALACAGLSALGIALVATAGGFRQLALGYGVCFGASVGATYILFQQTVNLAVTSRRGLVNGYLVSLLPAGAMIAAPVFGWAIPAMGVRAALGWFAAVLALLGLVSAWLTAQSASPSRPHPPAPA